MDLACQPVIRNRLHVEDKLKKKNMDNSKLKPVSPTRNPGPLPKPKGSAASTRSKPQSPSAEDSPIENKPDGLAELLEQYGCGPIQFSGSANALYERHLIFDSVMPVGAAGARDKFEALARSVRDLLVPTLDSHARTLHAKEPQARLLSLDGVPAWPLHRE